MQINGTHAAKILTQQLRGAHSKASFDNELLAIILLRLIKKSSEIENELNEIELVTSPEQDTPSDLIQQINRDQEKTLEGILENLDPEIFEVLRENTFKASEAIAALVEITGDIEELLPIIRVLQIAGESIEPILKN